MKDVMNMVTNDDKDGLYKLMQGNFWLAFFDVDFGGWPGGIFTAGCPIEALHALDNGIFKHCLEESKKSILGPTGSANLDEVVKQWIYDYPRQRLFTGHRDVFPRLYFQDGISNLSDTTADTKVGQMFALVLATLTTEGNRVYREARKSSEETTVDTIYAFEMLLSYWSWLKRDTYWKRESKSDLLTAQWAISTLLENLQNSFPRTSGSEWNIPKFHEQLHVAYNIYLFGAHSNVHSGPHEHNHVENSKKPFKHTQKVKTKTDFQLANRLVDRYVIDAAFKKVSKKPISNLSNVSSEYHDGVGRNGGKYIVTWKREFVGRRNRKMIYCTTRSFKWLTKSDVGTCMDESLLKYLE